MSSLRNFASLWQVRKLLKKEEYPTGAWLIVGRWTAEVGPSHSLHLPHSLTQHLPSLKAANQYRAFCEARANGTKLALQKLTTDEFFDVRSSQTNSLPGIWE